jgi:hypothetical protein
MKWIKNHVAKSCNTYFYNKSMITYNIVDKVMNDTINEGNALRSINIYSDFGIEQNSGLQGSRNLIISQMSETFLSSTGINARYLATVIVNGKHILIGTRASENLKPHLQWSTNCYCVNKLSKVLSTILDIINPNRSLSRSEILLMTTTVFSLSMHLANIKFKNLSNLFRMKASLDRDSDPGPLPYQGNALPG